MLIARPAALSGNIVLFLKYSNRSSADGRYSRHRVLPTAFIHPQSSLHSCGFYFATEENLTNLLCRRSLMTVAWQSPPPPAMHVHSQTVRSQCHWLDAKQLFSYHPLSRVQVIDNGGGAVSSFTGNACAGSDCAVTVSIVCCPVDVNNVYIGTGVLSGTKTVVAVDGRAHFSDLAVSTAGNYILQYEIGAIRGITRSLTVKSSSFIVQVSQ